MASKRKAFSKKLRFEVFNRDSFTCQYCGKHARNRLNYVPNRCLQVLEDAHASGIPLDVLKRLSLRANSWTAFERELYE